MKKIVFSALFITFTCFINAQDAPKSVSSSKSKFGLKGGLNHTTVTKGNFEDGLDPRTSFYVGFFGEIPVVDKVFSIQPEFIYSRQGFENNYMFLGNNYKTKYNIDYINVPILAKIHLGNVIALEGGPQFGLKINENIETENSTNDNNDFNDFDTALAGGLSLNFDSVFLSARYTYSLNEIIKDSDSKNSVIQVGIGFYFE